MTGSWMTTEEACEAFGLGRSGIYRRVRVGTLEGRKVGRRWMVRVPSSPPPSRRPTDALDASLSTADVAAMLGVGTTGVRQQVNLGRLPAYRLAGRAYRFRPEDVEAFMEGNRITPGGMRWA